MAVPRLVLGSPRTEGPRSGGGLSDEVELYQHTYTTLLRSSGETHLRVLEPSHRAMGSSLHPLADSDELDLGAFLYAVRRLPDAAVGASLIVMGQEREAFRRAGIGPLEDWEEIEAPARRRRWYDSHRGTLAVLLASGSDVDDLVPTLVAFQIEWNKMRARMRAVGFPGRASAPGARAREGGPRGAAPPAMAGAEADGDRPGALPELAPDTCAAALGASAEDWARLAAAWGPRFSERLRLVRDHKLSLRLRMLGGTQVGYARLTRRWWAPVQRRLQQEGLADRAIYFVSSNTHSLANLVTGVARQREEELVAYIEREGAADLREELQAFRDGRTEGSWENFLYFTARDYFDSRRAERRELEVAAGVTHLRSASGLRVPAQVIPLAALHPERLDSRLGPVDAARLERSPAVIVNIDYPLGLAAYNILREVAVDVEVLRAVYVLGKAATLNADVGDVMISSVVHDEHSGSTYWLDNAFTVDDLAPDLRFGTGLDNQRAVTVKSTFLQNRAYLDFYYREAFTVVEMEAGPYCNALYEIADADRHPVGEAVNFSKLPLDFGIIHYASDTPYTQARTLGARGLSYYGMDSTYASSLAILRRILRLEGVLAEQPAVQVPAGA
jgi:hypothetical protein